jgi:hypothetical protein
VKVKCYFCKNEFEDEAAKRPRAQPAAPTTPATPATPPAEAKP